MNNKDDSSYRKFTGKSESHKAFNSLVGIIEGITIDKEINQIEIDELDMWCIQHEFLSKRNPFKDLITNIQVIISDNIVTHEEINDMRWLCNKFKNGFDYYDEYTSQLHVLQGICHGILADGVISDIEIKELYKWLSKNEQLATFFPYDEISKLISDILSDGIIDENERNLLTKYFSEFVKLNDNKIQEQIDSTVKDIKIGSICMKVPDIRFIENQFCFTGVSSKSSRKEIVNLIEEYGGKYVNSVSKKTNYLIVGDDGNPCWAYACYGRKVEKSIILRKEGVQILIIHEDDFWLEIESRGTQALDFLL